MPPGSGIEMADDRWLSRTSRNEQPHFAQTKCTVEVSEDVDGAKLRLDDNIVLLAHKLRERITATP